MPQATPTQVSAHPYNGTALNVSWLPIDDTRENIRGKLLGFRVSPITLIQNILQTMGI